MVGLDPLPLDVDLIIAEFVHRMHTHTPDPLPEGEDPVRAELVHENG